MKVIVSERAAIARLSRRLKKNGQGLIVNKENSPSYREFGRYTIINDHNCVEACSSTLTGWLREERLLKEFEAVEGEE
ncbi:hypothetical protein ACTS35_25195 [Citrobacter freundii]|uniref:hypothetical protein n=1 Tax=Enterobacteriaceae TaxID=543 RepID=UPI001938361B|nr:MULTISPECIES: hypothetical protein [Enterobacteriaceae]EJG4277158.1 hypothetical protein [Salmonella enterica]ELM7837543.1 hypothetical protein [Escherichia coli]ELM7935284.1 hypothetical protein [Escherichia coli]MBQ5151361.1 hypothetical protein [Citrobacter freundii]MCN2395498.1 hypothetical protein [Escherichia coli]